MNWYKIAQPEKSVFQWIEEVDKNPNSYYDCPYQNSDEIQKATKEGVIKKIKINPYTYPNYPNAFIDLPEVQHEFIESCKKDVFRNFTSFNELYKRLKSYSPSTCFSLSQKLRREIAKFLYYKIKERPLFYYHMRTLNLDSDLRNDILTIAKHLKLTIANPWKEET